MGDVRRGWIPSFWRISLVKCVVLSCLEINVVNGVMLREVW